MNTPLAPQRPAAPAHPSAPAAGPAKQHGATIDSAALLQGGKVITINHHGELYRLQATRQGKLILTK